MSASCFTPMPTTTPMPLIHFFMNDGEEDDAPPKASRTYDIDMTADTLLHTDISR